MHVSSFFLSLPSLSNYFSLSLNQTFCVCVRWHACAFLWLLVASLLPGSWNKCVSFVFNLAVLSTAPLSLSFWELWIKASLHLFRLAIFQLSCRSHGEIHFSGTFNLWWQMQKQSGFKLMFLSDSTCMTVHIYIYINIWIWAECVSVRLCAYLHHIEFACKWERAITHTGCVKVSACFIQSPCIGHHILMISPWSNYSAACITLSMWHTISRQLTWASECQPIGCATSPVSDIFISTVLPAIRVKR